MNKPTWNDYIVEAQNLTTQELVHRLLQLNTITALKTDLQPPKLKIKAYELVWFNRFRTKFGKDGAA